MSMKFMKLLRTGLLGVAIAVATLSSVAPEAFAAAAVPTAIAMRMADAYMAVKIKAGA
jgi:hypothetical protein